MSNEFGLLAWNPALISIAPTVNTDKTGGRFKARMKKLVSNYGPDRFHHKRKQAPALATCRFQTKRNDLKDSTGREYLMEWLEYEKILPSKKIAASAAHPGVRSRMLQRILDTGFYRDLSERERISIAEMILLHGWRILQATNTITPLTIQTYIDFKAFRWYERIMARSRDEVSYRSRFGRRHTVMTMNAVSIK